MNKFKNRGENEINEQVKKIKDQVELYQESEEEKLKREDFEAQTEHLYVKIASSVSLVPEEQDHIFAEINNKVREYKELAADKRRGYIMYANAADELEARMWDVRKSQRKRRLLSPPPANSIIDLAEINSENFAQGMNIYKVLLILFIGSFVGVVIELIWCFVTNGYFESRSGLVWGPFNLLYGIGAVALTTALYPYRNRSSAVSLIGGMAVGSIVEYICSWLQELCFGTRSWNYSHLPLNIDGRICLLYSVFWGVLGVLWIKSIYPRIAKMILKIPNKAGKIITWALTAFIVLDAVVSFAACMRWSERVHGEPASNFIEEILDDRFPDTRMTWIYANSVYSD